MPIFKHRKGDFEEVDQEGFTKNKKPLTKTKERYQKTNADRFGGATSYGPHVKTSKKNEEKKTYYLAPHNVIEYFGYEILNRIGFNTPKSRIVTEDYYYGSGPTKKVYSTQVMMASRAVEGYIPIEAYIHDPSYIHQNQGTERNKKLQDIHAKYRLDMQNQVVVNNETGENYKITGNLFAANIGATLLADRDFQPEELNVGLVKQGDRFVAYLIDKDMLSFTGKKYEENLTETDQRVLKSKLFDSATIDQQLYIVSEIEKSCNGDSNRIFFNPRVKATELPDEQKIDPQNLKQMVDDFNKTASSTVGYFQQKLSNENSPDALSDFRKREAIRNELADVIVNRLAILASNEDKDALKQIIIEDLRSRYYQNDFSDKKNIARGDILNESLIQHVMKDQLKELKTLGIISMGGELNHLAEFIKEERVRLETRGERNKSASMQSLESDIKNNMQTFAGATEEDQKKIITNICKHLDIICHHNTGLTPWLAAKSEKNWLAFKSEHREALQAVNPEIDVKSPLKKVREMTYSQYRDSRDVFASINKVKKDKIDSSVVPEMKSTLNRK